MSGGDRESGEPPRGGGTGLSVLVPCYNEAAVIDASYAKLKAACEEQGRSYEIILGDDGSSDNTLSLIESIAAADPQVRVTSHYPNRGAGFTYREMCDAASGEIIVFMDADMAMPPAVGLPKLVDALGEADLAVGSRYAGVKADYPVKRRVFSRGYTVLTRLLFHLKVTDTQTGFLGFYRNILSSLDLQSDGFELLVELIAQANACGYSIVEVGLPWRHDTTSGETNVWKESVKMFSGTIRVKRRFDQFRRRVDVQEDVSRNRGLEP